ncbi:MAG: choice-of-anchor D domain-containing protein [Bacteroidota bacterium]|nr:choice-of-anchor D domain-containing protein [Bacteroidota bacterium]
MRPIAQGSTKVFLLLLFPCLFALRPSLAAVYVVTSTADAGPGTLRAAITAANLPGPDQIVFAIPGAGPHTILPLTPLPPINDPAGVVIDGYTQPGSSPGLNPPSTAVLMVILDGSFAGAAHGLHIVSPLNVIRGLVIRNFQQDGIRVEATAAGTHSNMIYGNFIGTNQSGTAAAGNGVSATAPWAGVNILAPQAALIKAFNNTVARNLISANYAIGVSISSCPPADVNNNHIDSNYIGTDITGMNAIGNRVVGVYIGEAAHHNWVVRNVISGNDTDGVSIVGFQGRLTNYNQILDNAIGVASDRSSPLPNKRDGVNIGQYAQSWLLGDAPDNTVAQNIIAYNGRNGITVWEHPYNTTNTDRNQLSRNSIYANGQLGIDLDDDGVSTNDIGDIDNGANQTLNTPLISSATPSGGQTTISGTISIDTNPSQATVEVFIGRSCSPTGIQGRTFIGQATPDGAGNWSLTVSGTVNVGDTITATVTDMNRNTSEFGAGAAAGSGAVIAGPSSVSFGTVILGRDATRSIAIHNTGTSQLTVSTATITPAAYTIVSPAFPITISASDSAVLQIRFSPGSRGSYNGNLTLNSNAGNAPSFPISLSGTCVDSAAEIHLHTSAVNFGSVLAGSSSDRTILYTNTGNATLSIASQAIGGTDQADFTITRPGNSTVGAGGSDSLDIRFTPSTVGTKSALLTLQTNDPNTPLATVSLTGVCAATLAVLTIDSMRLEFGSVPVGNHADLSIRIRNTGNAPLLLGSPNITGSDAAHFTVMRPFGGSIPAAGADSITLRFSPASTGWKSATLVFTTSDPNIPACTIALQGTGITSSPAITLSPLSLDFGPVILGTDAIRKVMVGNTGNAMLSITSQRVGGADSSLFAIVRPCNAMISPGGIDSILVRFTPLSAGAKSAQLVIVCNDPQSPVNTVTMSGRGSIPPPAISLSVTSVDFGSVTVGSGITRSILVGNTGGLPLLISSQTIGGGDSSSFAITRASAGTIAPGGTDTIIIRFAPATSGTMSSQLRIASNDPVQPLVVLSLTGIGVPAVPVITLNVTEIDFGSVFIGSSSSRWIRITNTGNAVLTLSSQALAGNDRTEFAIVRASGAAIAAGGKDSVQVRFSPTSAGQKTAELRIASNDPAHPTVTVSLRGTGALRTGARITVVPQTIDFGTTPLNAPVDRTLRILNAGDAILTLGSRTLHGADSASFTIVRPGPSSIPPAGSDSMTIRFLADRYGAKSASLEIASNDTTSPVTRIALAALCASGSGARITASRMVIDFGYVPLLSTKDEDIKIGNTGSADLVISQQFFYGQDASQFSLVVPVVSPLKPGGSSTARIRLSPVTPGAKSAHFRIQSNDQTLPLLDIDLSGTTVHTDTPPTAPSDWVLSPPYPNPFSTRTTISLTVPVEGNVTVRIHDGLGRVVRILASELMERGIHRLIWDGTDETGGTVPAGVYRCNAVWELGTRSITFVFLPER